MIFFLFSQELQLFKYMTQQQTITTAVRVRPLFPLQNRDDIDCLTVQPHKITIKAPSVRKQFDLPFVFGSHTSQQNIFESLLQPLADSFLIGYSCAFLSCGPRSSGKTHTLEGGDAQETKGIVSRLFDYLMHKLADESDRTHLLRASYVDVCEEEIIDLLGVRRGQVMTIAEKGREVGWKGVALKHANNTSDLEDFYELGNRKRRFAYKKKRRVGHQTTSIFTLYLQSCDKETRQSLRRGKLHLIDMAAFPTDVTLKCHYNLSTYALRNIANSLVYGQGKSKIPYHDSKVTMLLRQNLGGFGKTTVLFHLSPASQHISATLQSLRMAKVLGQVYNCPDCHSDPSEMMLLTRLEELETTAVKIQEMQAEIQEIRQKIIQLSNQKMQEGDGGENEFLTQGFIHQKQRQYYEKQISKLEHEKSSLSKKRDSIRSLFLKIQSFPKKLIYEISNQNWRMSNHIKAQAGRLPRSPESIGSQNGANRPYKQQIFELQKQFQAERQILLSRIRELQRQFRFYQQASQQTVKQEQLDILRHSSHYDQTSRSYQIPHFAISHKKLSLAGKFYSPSQSQLARTMMISARSNGASKSISSSKASWRGAKEIMTGVSQLRKEKDKKEQSKEADEYGLGQVKEKREKTKLSQCKSASNLFRQLSRMRFK